MLTRIHIPGVKDLHVAVDGILWNGEGRFFYNGVVIQFRPVPLQLATLGSVPPKSVVKGLTSPPGLTPLRHGTLPSKTISIHGPQPSAKPMSPLRSLTLCILWCKLAPVSDSRFVLLLHPLWIECNRPLTRYCQRIAHDRLRTPNLFGMTAAFTLHAEPTFPLACGSSLMGPPLMSFNWTLRSHSRMSQHQPTGYCWYPQEIRGNVGIAICRPSHLPPPARCRGRLDALDERPPFVLGSALTAYDLFGSSSEGPSVHNSSTSSLSSSTSSADTSSEPPHHSAASSSAGVSLLQKEAIIHPMPPQRRPVPTPCRSRLSALSVGTCDQHMNSKAHEPAIVPDTVESAQLQCPECHNQQMPHPPLPVRSVVSPPEATLLSIHGALETQSTSESEQLRILDCRLSAPWFHTWQHSLPALRLPAWLRTLVTSPRPPGPVIAVHVYTDGSAKPGFAGGWAAVLVDEVLTPAGSAYCYAAYMAGNMRDFQLTPLCDSADNIAAEHAAAVMASAWMHVWADCEGAVHAANASQKPAGSGKHCLGECLRILQQAHESRPGLRTFCWTKGHSGNAFNELADALAYAAREQRASTRIPDAFFPLLCHPAFPWLWLLYGSPALPSLAQLSRGEYEPPEGPAPHHIKCSSHPSRKQKPGKPNLLGVASYNCQTLRNRRNYVQSQFQQDDLHIIGLQESRDRKSYQVAGGDCFGFHSVQDRAVVSYGAKSSSDSSI